MRTFIAIEIPKDIRKKVDNLIKEFKEKGLPIKWVKFENLHITLKFLGEVEEGRLNEITSALKEVSKGHSGFSINLEDLGCFPSNKNPRVLWIGVKQGKEEVVELARALEDCFIRLGFRAERRFHPHLTIGRIKKFCLIDEIISMNFQSRPFLVDSFSLFKSTLRPEGPIYERLVELRLFKR